MGLAARRARGEAPKLSIKDVEGDFGLHLPPGGGTSGAGLGRGRPQMDDVRAGRYGACAMLVSKFMIGITSATTYDHSVRLQQ